MPLGPGPEWSVQKNTIPSLKTLEPSEYFAVDIELEFTREACRIVSQELPHIPVQSVAVDFHAQHLPNPKSATSLIWYPGSTLGNLPSKSDKTFSDNQFITNHLERLRSFQAGSSSNSGKSDAQRYLVLLMDSYKHDKASMVNLYASPEAEGCFLSILHKLKRDLKASSFNPDAFTYCPCWNEKSSVVEHQFTALENQEFSIFDCFTEREATIQVSKGDRYSLANSIKPSCEDMRDALSRSGWEPLKSSWDTERQFHIHLARSH
ncbi:MAG: L-histidine N(alpha)-methyltransferase [Geitlerinemataceae cyanobacterium]